MLEKNKWGGYMSRKIIIVGGGIGGLSTGCYGQMNGYETEVFEMHNIPGGLCTSWNRKGYTIDGGVGFVVGTKSGTNFNRMWRELGVVQDRIFINHDEIARVKKDGKEFVLYTDIDKLERHMLDIAPEDEELIKGLVNDIRKISKFDAPIDTSTFPEKMKMVKSVMPYASIFGKYNLTLKEFAQKFKNPFLREVLPLMYNLPEFPAMAAIMSVVNGSKGNGGFPAGGSLEFAQAISERYMALGGKIYYKSKVDRILVKNDRAVGIKLADGTEHWADIVVSACDGYETIFNMLRGKYTSQKVLNTYKDMKPCLSSVRVYLGVNEDLSSYPHSIILGLDSPIKIGGGDRNYMAVQHYCFDKALSPEGKSLMTVIFNSEYGYWEKLYADREKYRMEKDCAAQTVIKELGKYFDGIKDKVEMVDVSTPMTYVRYTNNWQGSYMGWMLTPKTLNLKLGSTLLGLGDFYMAGQWTVGLGGLPPAAMSGRDVMKLICKNDKKGFVTSEL